ncbi:hypothetical protein SBRCBS47491_006329 [Sporothrix bragantina]|uniref:Wbp11/ELF5/Saf1 N-terminal domain-containing protein n=1 Tax=Sporothrix bragantina TaxID=671064 RepID=A0ABP0C432_9PEZI
MPKERNFNPVQAQRKADKAKAIKKGKAEVAAARNERLGKKNPDRIRKQIEDLKAITEGGGKLTTHEGQVLEGLEKELKAVTKAREALGERAPTFGRGDYPSHRGGHDANGGFGRKRRRDDGDKDDGHSSADEDVPDDVRRIPMPRDTPPPIPKRYLDEYYAKRRAQRNANANTEPLGEGRSNGGRGEGRRGEEQTGASTSTQGSPSRPTPPAAPARPVEVKTVYEAKPVVRDLQKEAVSAFMPTVVRRKLDKSRGMGGLLEPEEADRLEREGYLKTSLPATDENSGSGSGGRKQDAYDSNRPESDQPHSSRPSEASGQGQPRVYRATVEDVDDEEG